MPCHPRLPCPCPCPCSTPCPSVPPWFGSQIHPTNPALASFSRPRPRSQSLSSSPHLTSLSSPGLAWLSLSQAHRAPIPSLSPSIYLLRISIHPARFQVPDMEASASTRARPCTDTHTNTHTHTQASLHLSGPLQVLLAAFPLPLSLSLYHLYGGTHTPAVQSTRLAPCPTLPCPFDGTILLPSSIPVRYQCSAARPHPHGREGFPSLQYLPYTTMYTAYITAFFCPQSQGSGLE